jgi:hypothetical protein
MQPGESLPMGPHCAPLLYLRRINPEIFAARQSMF